LKFVWDLGQNRSENSTWLTLHRLEWLFVDSSIQSKAEAINLSCHLPVQVKVQDTKEASKSTNAGLQSASRFVRSHRLIDEGPPSDIITRTRHAAPSKSNGHLFLLDSALRPSKSSAFTLPVFQELLDRILRTEHELTRPSHFTAEWLQFCPVVSTDRVCPAGANWMARVPQ
jgi:hypothetical protein